MQITLNLATRCYYNRQRVRMLLVSLLIVLLALSSIGIMRLLAYRSEATRLNAEIADFERRLSAHPAGVSPQEFASYSQRVGFFNQLLNQRRESQLALLDALEAALPAGVTYTRIEPTPKDRQVRLEGQVRSLTILSELLEQLGAAQGFRSPTLLSTEAMANNENAGANAGLHFVLTAGWDSP